MHNENNLPTIKLVNMHHFNQDGKVWNIDHLPEGFVIKANLDFSESSLTELPDLSHVSVKGNFYCERCQNITSLKGAPKEVGGDFCCSSCYNLTSLEGASKKVLGSFDCGICVKLKSLKGAPQDVGKDFGCTFCKNLISLEGAPKVVRNFYCGFCTKLKSLKGGPEYADFLECGGCGSLKSFKYAPKNLCSDNEPDISDFIKERMHKLLKRLKNIQPVKSSERIHLQRRFEHSGKRDK